MDWEEKYASTLKYEQRSGSSVDVLRMSLKHLHRISASVNRFPDKGLTARFSGFIFPYKDCKRSLPQSVLRLQGISAKSGMCCSAGAKAKVSHHHSASKTTFSGRMLQQCQMLATLHYDGG
jgi:hypothetical protein